MPYSKRKAYARRPVRQVRRRTQAVKGLATALKIGAAGYSAYQRYGARTGSTTDARLQSGTATITKKKRETYQDGGGLDMDRYTYQSGRPMKHTLSNAWKLLTSAKDRVTLRWSNLTSFDLPGAVPLVNRQVTPTAAGSTARRVVPMHVYDVSSFVNNIEGTVTLGGVAQTPYFTDLGDAVWAPLFGQTAGGTPISTWQLEDTPGQSGASGANIPLRADIWSYLSVKMNLYGTLQRPTKYDIKLIKLKADRFVPRWDGTGYPQENNGNSNSDENKEHDSFWQAMAKPFVFNNLNDQPASHRADYTVLKSWNFIINPPENTETLVQPHFKECNLFMRMNRLQRYDWQPTTQQIGADINTGKWMAETSKLQPFLKPTERVYMVIRALAASATPITVDSDANFSNCFDVNFHPSYDIVIKTQHELVE